MKNEKNIIITENATSIKRRLYTSSMNHLVSKDSLDEWNSFFVEYIESLIANPFRFFQEIQFKKPDFYIDYSRFNRFINKTYTGAYPDIQLYNFFAFLYAINYFSRINEINQWRSSKQPFFLNKSFNELCASENGIIFIKSQLRKLPILN